MEFEECAAAEIDAEVVAAFDDRRPQADQNYDEREGEPGVTQPQEPDFWIVEDAELADAQARSVAEHHIEDRACDEQCGKHARYDSDHQGECESLDRAGTELKQDDGRDDGRQVGVENGKEGASISVVDRCPDGLSGS